MSPMMQANTIEKINYKANCRSTINAYCFWKLWEFLSSVKEVFFFLLIIFEYRSSLNSDKLIEVICFSFWTFSEKSRFTLRNNNALWSMLVLFSFFHILVLQEKTILMILKILATYWFNCTVIKKITYDQLGNKHLVSKE